MVLLQANYIVLECVKSRSSEVACLPHAAPHHLAVPMCLGDEFTGSDEERAGRGAQSLREADGDRVEQPAVIARRLVAGYERIEEARAIEVHGNIVFPADRANALDLPQLPTGTSAPVNGIFN